MNNLELYKTFYYVAKAGSITAAAQQLSLTQPAVSQSMKQLEAQLNVSLFQRTAKGIRLTKEGEILFPRLGVVRGENAQKERAKALWDECKKDCEKVRRRFSVSK